jgi:hypothetical protein
MASRLQHVNSYWTIGDSGSRVYVVPGGSGSRLWDGDCESARAGGADGSANGGGVGARYWARRGMVASPSFVLNRRVPSGKVRSSLGFESGVILFPILKG